MVNKNENTSQSQSLKYYDYLKKWKIGYKDLLCLFLVFICLVMSNILYKKNQYPSELLLDAVLNNNIEVTRFLLEKEININHKYKYGHTLLHCAALYGDLEMVKLLVKKGAKLLKNEFELTAKDSARDMNNKRVFEYLEKSYK